MGGIDKPLIRLGGRTVLARIVARLAPRHGPFALSANGDPARWADPSLPEPLPVLPDAPGTQGPLAGVRAGLAWAEALGAPALLTVAGDAPFLPADLADRLAPAPALAASGGKRHPPCALWPVDCRPALDRHLAALDPAERRSWSVQGFASAIGMRVVEFATEPFDPFLDIDTPDDLARAERLAAC